MVALAVRALDYLGMVCVAAGSGGGHSVLVVEILECSFGMRPMSLSGV